MTREERRALDRSHVLFDHGLPSRHQTNPLAIALMLGGTLAALGFVGLWAMREAVKEYPWVFVGGALLVALALGVGAIHKARVNARLERALHEPDTSKSPELD